MGQDKLREWMEEGKVQGAKYVIILYDMSERSCCPVYAKDERDFKDKMEDYTYTGKGMKVVSEIYDLTGDIEKQLCEGRAHHPPFAY